MTLQMNVITARSFASLVRNLEAKPHATDLGESGGADEGPTKMD
jgi:hypothetical protein